MSRITAVYWLMFSLLFSGCGYASSSLPSRDDVKAFIENMIVEHQFSRKDLFELFQKVRLQDDIIRAMERPAEAKPWYVYRTIFITDRQIDAGVDFWRHNAQSLAAAEQEFGVPAEIIVAIIGIETRYGENTGSYRVIDALSTLAFNYPKRSDFFTDELEHFLILCREERMDPLEPVGSYAGAMGIPQFMPSSFRKFATDQDYDGRRDIWTSNRDAIGSVANYFLKHGWVKGAPVTFQAYPRGNVYQKFLTKGLDPDTTVARIQAAGIHIPPNISLNQEAKLLHLDNEYGPVYWVTLANFYVITRYNHSALYAMAVYQLSREILYRTQSTS
ncbi:MAG: lytic murein transglycosylase B [Methylococcales bacterium]